MRTVRPVAVPALLLAGLLLLGCSDSDDMLNPSTGDGPCMDDTGNRFQECEEPGNGTVTDTDTGLIWLKYADCFGLGSFASATASAADLADGECGLLDGSSAGNWRLPTKAEWEAIVKPDCPFGSPHLPDTPGDGCWSENDPFFEIRPSAYWSATSGSSPRYVWIVYLHDAYFIPDVKTDTHYVWPVRDR